VPRRKDHTQLGFGSNQSPPRIEQHLLFALERASADVELCAGRQYSADCVGQLRVAGSANVVLQVAAEFDALRGNANRSEPGYIFLTLRKDHGQLTQYPSPKKTQPQVSRIGAIGDPRIYDCYRNPFSAALP
jgi:hypothetical protein